MKKKEAEALVKEEVDIIFENISKLIENSTIISGIMNFNTAKIDGYNMSTIDIYIPDKKIEKHLNLNITSDHKNIIYKEFLDRIISDFLPHETIGVTKFYSFRSMQSSFDGIDIINTIGSKIKINMYGIDKNISNEYNIKYEQYKNSIKKVDDSEEGRIF